MALLWAAEKNAVRYEVRQAGHSVRLYTNGVFHSQYNPHAPLGGNVWDLLTLPSFFLFKPPQRILLLGVGGGAVIRQLNALFSPAMIVGVELDRQHLQIAKRFFQVSQNARTQLIHADAVEWLQGYRGEAFDMVIDDLFVGDGNTPRRAVNADGRWCRLLARHVRSQGVVVINFDSARVLRQCGFLQQASLGAAFADRLRLQVKGYDNRIGAFFKGRKGQLPERRARYRHQLQQHKPLVRRLNAQVSAIT